MKRCHRRLVVALLAALVACTCGFVPETSEAGQRSDRIADLIGRLPLLASEALREHYGCVVADTAGTRFTGLVLRTTSKRAHSRATRLVRDLNAESFTLIELAPRRLGERARLEVFRRIRAAVPVQSEEQGRLRVGFEPAINLTGCPKVLITLREGLATDTDIEWARTQRRRFGSDRVRLLLIAPAALMPSRTDTSLKDPAAHDRA